MDYLITAVNIPGIQQNTMRKDTLPNITPGDGPFGLVQQNLSAAIDWQTAIIIGARRIKYYL